MEIQFAKWGNSIAMRIPSKLAEAVGIEPGSSADISVKKNQLIITPHAHVYRLQDLLDQITTENRHGETSTGNAVGNEVV